MVLTLSPAKYGKLLAKTLPKRIENSEYLLSWASNSALNRALKIALKASLLNRPGLTHGFFTRRGGVSTGVYASLDEAIAGVGALTWGQMCDSVICTFGVMRGELLEPALTLTAKGGTCVITSVAPIAQAQADVNLFMLAMMNKEIKGCLYGSESPRVQIPKLLNLYRDGILKIDELITETYSLDQVNQGYADIEAGRVLRGVIVF